MFASGPASICGACTGCAPGRARGCASASGSVKSASSSCLRRSPLVPVSEMDVDALDAVLVLWRSARSGACPRSGCCSCSRSRSCCTWYCGTRCWRWCEADRLSSRASALSRLIFGLTYMRSRKGWRGASAGTGSRSGSASGSGSGSVSGSGICVEMRRGCGTCSAPAPAVAETALEEADTGTLPACNCACAWRCGSVARRESVGDGPSPGAGPGPRSCLSELRPS
ncbi:hypothetical protein DFH11DRAFT_1622674 [Phellopilus nigrolimitatus]|nr:hypothetical protein DFH11DRAFT_1622674 [Phellopilus nigrolimitatus]